MTNQTVVADPDAVDATLPITRQLHRAIVTEDGMNPQSRTTRALLAAVADLETAFNALTAKTVEASDA